MKALNATLLALLLGASASASAHNLWTQGENKDVFEADLIYGHEFPKPEVIPEARLVLFEAPQVISASGTQTLVQSGENYHYRHSAKLGKGTHVLLGTYKPTYWTKKADGKWAMAKTRADFPDAQSCGLYSMSGKSFVIIDDDGAFATKPVADAKVVGSPAGFNSEEVEIEAFYAETDKNGEFSFRALKPGLWYLSSEVEQAPKDPKVCDKVVDEFTLSFNVK